MPCYLQNFSMSAVRVQAGLQPALLPGGDEKSTSSPASRLYLETVPQEGMNSQQGNIWLPVFKLKQCTTCLS